MSKAKGGKNAEKPAADDAVKIDETTAAADSADSEGVYVQVVKIMGRTGSRGQVTQVKCNFVHQPQRRPIIRNVRGPVRKDDILILLETEREARRLR